MYSGIINVYKEKGFTSFDVVAKLRGILHQKKIGHTGTLDPEAEGILPVCLGKATKVCDLLTDKDKEYEAVLRLGIETDTQDLTGNILRKKKVEVSKEEVESVIQSFVGSYDQIPPMYSALKVNGQKLCDLARKGVTVERKPRRVTIFEIEILDIDLPQVRIRVHCSKGTYIRTLCQDIGEKLGCLGCMESLLRTRVAIFDLDPAFRVSEIEKMFRENHSEFEKQILPVDGLFPQNPRGVIDGSGEKMICNGNRIPRELVHMEDPESGRVDLQQCRLYDEQKRFIGLYEYHCLEDDYKPVKIFAELNERGTMK